MPESRGSLESLRARVREFIARESGSWAADARARSWMSYDRAFSRKVGAQGWIGMTWPHAYGGAERATMERYVVIEELLAAGAPVGAHWVADRQSGPLLLRYGSQSQRQRWLPGIIRGETTFCIGMSEPDAGSDLASLRTRAIPVEDGWLLNGTKIWTTFAQHAEAMIALVRTSGQHGDRQKGLSQVLIDLELPGVAVRPIVDITGDRHFCEVSFDNVRLGADALIGKEGDGWQQVTAELALERSGPERYLSSFVLLEEFVGWAASRGERSLLAPIGNMVAELWSLRTMSLDVTTKLGAGQDVTVEAAIVKDLGNRFEQDLPRVVQSVVDCDLRPERAGDLGRALGVLLQLSPAFSLRGGTRGSDSRNHRAWTRPAMNEQRELLTAAVARLFEVELTAARRERARETGWSGDFWELAQGLGLHLLLVPEEQGGFGGTQGDACEVARLAGRYAVPAPIVAPIVENILTRGSWPKRCRGADGVRHPCNRCRHQSRKRFRRWHSPRGTLGALCRLPTRGHGWR